jgi:predicted RNase H-like HicB family nuclease
LSGDKPNDHGVTMERIVNIHIEKLPEGVYLATSTDVQGLVAQGRTTSETLEIACDVVRKLLEAQAQSKGSVALPAAKNDFDYPLIVGV